MNDLHPDPGSPCRRNVASNQPSWCAVWHATSRSVVRSLERGGCLREDQPRCRVRPAPLVAGAAVGFSRQPNLPSAESRTRYGPVVRNRHSSPVALALVPSEFRERATRQRSDGPKAVRSCRQTSAALLATRSDDSSATACAHTTPKPVLLGSFPNIGLIRALHNSSRPHGPKPHGDNECLGIGYSDTEGGTPDPSGHHATVANLLHQHAWTPLHGCLCRRSSRILGLTSNNIHGISCFTGVICNRENAAEQGVCVVSGT